MKAQPEGKRVPVGTVRQGAAGRRANKWNGSKWVPVPVPGGASRSDAKQAASKPKRTASASAAAAANRSGVAKKAGAIQTRLDAKATSRVASAASRRTAKVKAKALGGKKKGL